MHRTVEGVNLPDNLSKARLTPNDTVVGSPGTVWEDPDTEGREARPNHKCIT